MKVIDFKNASCKHCYKCVRSCSVKAIRVIHAQAQIMNEYCVLCGHCLEICPQNAKTFASDMEAVKNYLKRGETVIASIAPSYLGILEYDHPGQVVGALKKLGFAQVRETAEGAAYVTAAYTGLLQEGKMDNMITTCCPSVNDLIEKYYPSLVTMMAPVVSPMVAHGMLIRRLYGDRVRVVFIGPCIAKKEEAEFDVRTRGYVDAVINFDELEQWLGEENIDIRQCAVEKMDNPDPKINRLYPVQNGVISSVLANYEKKEGVLGDGPGGYRRIFVDGIQSVSYTHLENIQKFTENLVSYFRYALKNTSIPVRLRQELDFVKSYVEIQKIRYPDSFYVLYDVEDELMDLPVLPLIIENFVENSTKYAAERGHMTEILVIVRKRNDYLDRKSVV